VIKYDRNGRVITTVDRRGVTVYNTYNKADMLLASTRYDAVYGDIVRSLKHCHFGPVIETETEGGPEKIRMEREYHWSGKVSLRKQTVDTYVMQVANTFDNGGNLLTATPTGSGASPWTKTFNIKPQYHAATPDADNFNRTAVVDNADSKTVVTVEPDYLGLLKTLKYGDYASTKGQLAYAYEKFLRVKTIQSNETPTKALDITFTRDFVGNITRRQEPAQAPAPALDYPYTYDGMDRMVTGEGESCVYDELSNLKSRGGSKNYVYQNAGSGYNQMRLKNYNDGTSYDYAYDENGNVVSVSGRYTMVYDNLNRLREITNAWSGDKKDRYWYNAGGLRYKRTEDATGTWATVYSMYEGEVPLMQEKYTASGRIEVRFNIVVRGNILSQYRRVYPSTDSVVYFYVDNLGSRRVVKSAAPAVIDRIRYTPWGEAVYDVDSGGGYKNFTGKEYDYSKLVYFNARCYDPIVGRFITEDPSRDGTGWYTYCGNNPINMIDANGRNWRDSATGGYNDVAASHGHDPKGPSRVYEVDYEKFMNRLAERESGSPRPWWTYFGWRRPDSRVMKGYTALLQLAERMAIENGMSAEEAANLDFWKQFTERFFRIPSSPPRWTYSQKTDILRGPNAEEFGGFSGRNIFTPWGEALGKNNPEYQDVIDIGPIPQGQWMVGPLEINPKTQTPRRWLGPLSGNRAFDTREWSTFYMHEGTISRGCIVTSEEAILSIPPGAIITITD
jgi:RHS repeat-associated protein